MIARIWCGRTAIKDYDAYGGFLKTLRCRLSKTPGFKWAADNEGHCNLITFWENLDVIKKLQVRNLKKQSTIERNFFEF